MNVYLVAFVCHLMALCVTAQESINAQEGFDVGKQVGIALAICFSVLACFTVTVNCIKKRCVKSNIH
jgi:hypothetical protein